MTTNGCEPVDVLRETFVPTSGPLRIAPLKFSLDGVMPSLPQALTLWHGGIGKILHEHFIEVFDLLYSPRSDQARLYAITPPLPDSPELRITLFGSSVEHAVAVTQAVIRLGMQGFSGQGQRFRLSSAGLETFTGSQIFHVADSGLTSWPAAYDASDFLEQREVADYVRIQLLTPLVLKEGNRFLRDAPEFYLFIRRLLGRISQVCHAANAELPYSKDRITEWLRQAASVNLAKAVLTRVQTGRQSGRTGDRMTFTGFTGKLEYAGDLTPFLGLLKLGEKLQLGGKTAFGFGAYHFDYANREEVWH